MLANWSLKPSFSPRPSLPSPHPHLRPPTSPPSSSLSLGLPMPYIHSCAHSACLLPSHTHVCAKMMQGSSGVETEMEEVLQVKKELPTIVERFVDVCPHCCHKVSSDAGDKTCSKAVQTSTCPSSLFAPLQITEKRARVCMHAFVRRSAHGFACKHAQACKRQMRKGVHV